MSYFVLCISLKKILLLWGLWPAGSMLHLCLNNGNTIPTRAVGDVEVLTVNVMDNSLPNLSFSFQFSAGNIFFQGLWTAFTSISAMTTKHSTGAMEGIKLSTVIVIYNSCARCVSLYSFSTENLFHGWPLTCHHPTRAMGMLRYLL